MAALPLILIAVLLYNAVAFGGILTGHPDIQAMLANGFTLPVFSGDAWRVTYGDLLVALSLALLFVETIRSAHSNPRIMLNHALSLLTFIGALVEFIVLKGFGTSAFFFVMAMCLFDVVAGYSISIVAARRDLHMLPHEDGMD